MKQLLATVLCSAVFLCATTTALAGGPAPTRPPKPVVKVNNNCNKNHPHIPQGGFYKTGNHSNPVEVNQNHVGCDVVWQPNIHKPNFVQIFYGKVQGGVENGVKEWEKTWWNVAKTPGVCPKGWHIVANANPTGTNPGWGAYLKEGADYCVKDIEHHFISVKK